MARAINRLSARSVAAATAPGRYADGQNLYLVVGPTGAKKWVFAYRFNGGQHGMGLGSARDVSLAKAREKAAEARAILAEGRNPLEVRRAVQADAIAVPTFGYAADELLRSMAPSWRNSKHRDQWAMTLSRKRDDDGTLVRDGYCLALVDHPVDAVDTEHVLQVLAPIWTAKAETASRLRGRIERVLDFAKTKGWRKGENPALWRGHLRNVLPARQKLQRGHHAAMSYEDVPTFVERLRASNAMAASLLEFTILTAARSGETREAVWSEIDFGKRVWAVPASRMKAGKEHRVPLPARAVEILHVLHDARTGDLVFPGQRAGRPLSAMAMDMLLRRMKVDVTIHGFRSAFRDWCGNETNFPREVAEQALAHQVGNAVERSYRRSDALEKRRALMNAWAAFVESSDASTSKVVRLHRKAGAPI